MKTNDELETLIQNLIERVNRIEAAVAHMKPASVVAIDPSVSATEVAITSLDTAGRVIEDRRLRMIAENARWMARRSKRDDR